MGRNGPETEIGGDSPSLCSFPEQLRDLSYDPPDLPYEDMMYLMFRVMGPYQWEIPSLEEMSSEEQTRFFQQEPKEVVRKWKKFCASALRGGQTAQSDLIEGEKSVVENQDYSNWKMVTEKVIYDPRKAERFLRGAEHAFELLEKGEKLELNLDFIWEVGRARYLALSLTNYYGNWMIAPDSMKGPNLHSNS